MEAFTGVIGIGVAVLIAVISIVLLGAGWASRYKKAGPDEALIVSGRGRKVTGPDGVKRKVGFRTITNGGTFIYPILEKFEALSLKLMGAEIRTANAISLEGVPLEVAGTALFKVGSDEGMIANAAERYLGRPDSDIKRDVAEVLEGSLRGVCATMTPENIYRDRAAFSQAITEAATQSLSNLGINLDTLTLKEIRDTEGYLDALGKKRTAEVKRDARQGEAEAEKQARVTEAEAAQAAQEAEARAATKINEANKSRDVASAQFTAETNRERAIAEQAEPLATAEAEQTVAKAQAQLEVENEAVERAKLNATVVANADAAKTVAVVEAQADAEQIKTRATGDAEAVRTKATADADARELEARAETTYVHDVGQATADAELARLAAEADGLGQKADATLKFNEATMSLEIRTRIIDTLPAIVAESVKPFEQVDKLELVDLGSGNGGNSPMDKLLGVSPQALGTLSQTLKSTLGIDIAELLTGTGDGLVNAVGDAPVEADAEVIE